MRLIDADALMRKISKWKFHNTIRRKAQEHERMTFEWTKGDIARLVVSAPTIAKDNNVLSSGWVSMNDRPPDVYGPYLVALDTIIPGLNINVHWWTGNGVEDYWRGAEVGSRITNVTHWMPLPELPEVRENATD